MFVLVFISFFLYYINLCDLLDFLKKKKFVIKFKILDQGNK